MSSKAMSSKAASSKATSSQPVSPSSTQPQPDMPTAKPSYFHEDCLPSINQSPEQAFGTPLFPDYVKPISTSQPSTRAAHTMSNTAASVSTGQSIDVEELLQQYGKLSHLVQEQTRMSHEQAQTLRQQMEQQAEQHQRELRQLEQAWSHRLDTVIANTQKLANSQLPEEQTVALPSRSNQPPARHQQMRQSATFEPSYQDQPVGHQARAKHRRPSPLQKVASTYRVPHRTQVRWVEKFLGAAPALVGLVVVGTAIAALSAIALSPTVLWPSLSIVIQTVIPFIFISGLISIGITAVWDSSR
ncbi:MAG: hypothetical protein AAF528_04275 [Cyanobacteria bacterium P01_C01_bin.121]